MDSVNLKSGNMKIELGTEKMKWTNAEGECLAEADDVRLFFPRFYGQELSRPKLTLEEKEKGVVLRYTFGEEDPIGECLVHLEEHGKYLSVSSEFTARKQVILNAVELLGEGTKMPLYKLINFRNRHCTENTWEDLVMGEHISTTTFSTDWQFAPHPSMLLFSKRKYHFFLGALDLPKTFGLNAEIDSYRVRRLEENYGEGEYGLVLAEGEHFVSTSYAFFVDYMEEPHDVIEKYTRLLIQEGYIPDPVRRKRFGWHRENLYCTWVDQGYLSDTTVPSQLHEQIQITLSAVTALNEEMVRKAVSIIEQERLPIRTILVDMGWAERGEWTADPVRFPDFRGLVDELHRKGFKVVIWWNWAEISNEARVDPRFLAEGGKLNKHGQRSFDFSNPVTQEEFLKPLFRRLFSGEPGCYDTDGVKTDFLSDKVHPQMRLADPSWRGEERYFYNTFRLFFREMRRYKEDAVHIGCAGHPYLAEFIDINRTYDVWSTNVYEHVNRGRMLAACSPGTPVAYDFHHFKENLEQYFEEAYRRDCSVQIGNVMGIKENAVSGWEAVDENYFKILRRNLGKLPR